MLINRAPFLYTDSHKMDKKGTIGAFLVTLTALVAVVGLFLLFSSTAH